MKLFLSMLILGMISLTACNKNCDSNNANCKDVPTTPADEACQAYFETWFYDSSTKECKKHAYSGCSARGFETQEECEKCKCK